MFSCELAEFERSSGGTLLRHPLHVLTEFKGYVMAWCFGDRPEVLRSRDYEFELEVPDLERNVPALIGICSSSAGIVDGKQCLLRPVVTCLARAGEVFDPPIHLRFPVGEVESMESGSDCGNHDEAEAAYLAYLKSTYVALTRADATSEWVPIHGDIVQTEEDVFVLEVTVSHFCDFALMRDIHVAPGCVELVSLPRLKRNSRRSHYHFVNLGTENLVVHCWGAARRRGFWESFKLRLGFGPTGGDAGVEARRTLVDEHDTDVYKVDVPGNSPGEPREEACLVVEGPESLTVVYTTQETVRSLMGGTHQLVQVWGRRPMQHKHVMVFGDLSGSKPLVADLRVENGVDVGESVRSKRQMRG